MNLNLILLYSLFLFIGDLFGQNLVPNPSFENVTSEYVGGNLGSPGDGLKTQSYWDDYYGAVCDWGIPTKKRPCYKRWTTPDILTNSDTPVTMSAHHGINFGYIDQPTEYLVARLDQDLVQHDQYSFEFYVNSSNNSRIKPYVAVTTHRPKSCYVNFQWEGDYQIISSTLVTISQFQNGNTWDYNWIKISGTFRSSKKHKYIVLTTSIDSPIESIYYDSIKLFKTGTTPSSEDIPCERNIELSQEQPKLCYNYRPLVGDFNCTKVDTLKQTKKSRHCFDDIAYYGKCGNGDDCWRVHLNNQNGSFSSANYGDGMWFKSCR